MKIYDVFVDDGWASCIDIKSVLDFIKESIPDAGQVKVTIDVRQADDEERAVLGLP